MEMTCQGHRDPLLTQIKAGYQSTPNPRVRIKLSPIRVRPILCGYDIVLMPETGHLNMEMGKSVNGRRLTVRIRNNGSFLGRQSVQSSM